MRSSTALRIGLAFIAASCTKTSKEQAQTAERSPALTADSAHRAMALPESTSDSAFRALQSRGTMAMGVDQNAATHHFVALPDGGRIELQMNTDDTLGVAQIRAHLQLIQHAFQAGDFSTPQFVHMRTMPGTATMAQLRDRITYVYHPLPRGGEVRITTSDPAALAAVHEFMGAQRTDHRAGGR